MPSDLVKMDIELGRPIIGDPEAAYRLGISDIGIPGSPKTIRMFETKEALCEFVRNTTLRATQCFNLMHLDLSGGDLSGANLAHAVMAESDFTGAIFDGAKFDATSFRQGNFTGASFKGAEIFCSDMSCADFTGADFSGAKIKENIGKHVTAPKARFTEADLRVCGFIQSNISGADFSRARISRLFLDLTDASFTRFRETKISGFVSVTQSNLGGAKVPRSLREKFRGAVLSAPGISCGEMCRMKRKRHAQGPGGVKC